MKIYSRKWVRATIFMLVVVPTITLYAKFVLAMKWLEGYRKAKRDDRWYHKLWKLSLIPVAAFFLFDDAMFDLIPGSILFRRVAEWGSRDKTFTARLKMYKNDYEKMTRGFYHQGQKYDFEIAARYELALKFGVILNKVDPGHF